MRILLTVVLLAIGAASISWSKPRSCCDGDTATMAACNGSANCKVCTNCSRCKHCKGGGTCGACKK